MFFYPQMVKILMQQPHGDVIKGALMANPCLLKFIQHVCSFWWYQSKLTLLESLRNDGRVWVPKSADDKRASEDIPENDRDYFLERMYPAYGNLVPRDVGSRAIKKYAMRVKAWSNRKSRVS